MGVMSRSWGARLLGARLQQICSLELVVTKMIMLREDSPALCEVNEAGSTK